MTVTDDVPAAASDAERETVGLARAAGVIGFGNVISRVLGLIREQVKAFYFGAGGAVDAFGVATLIPTMLHDLLIGGMVNSALVPVFSEYAKNKREELWALVSTLLSLTVALLVGFIIVVEVFAEPIVRAFGGFGRGALAAEFFTLSANLLRITVPAVLFMSLSGIFTALLYSLKRFTWPAFTVAVFNLGIVVMTILLHNQLGIASMAVGLLTGAVLQVVILIPGLRGAKIFASIRFYHPALKRVALLYLPILLGLLVEILFVRPFSYTLALQTGEGSLSWMNYATTLRQLPQGLVSIAISFAILPTLSRHAAAASRDDAAFQATLARGLRLTAILIIPAAIGLFLLGRPTIELLLEHGEFLSFDTTMTTLALYLYLLGLPFAAVDLLLVFAFYARQDTLTPALIGIASNVGYTLAAIALFRPFGLFSLMIADSFKQLLHTAIAAYLLRRQVGGLTAHRVGSAFGIATVSALLMSPVVLGLLWGVRYLLPGQGLLPELAAVSLPGLAGAAVYLWLVSRFGVEELNLLVGAIRRRLGQ